MSAVETTDWRTVEPVRDPVRADALGKDAVLLARVRAGDDRALGHVYDQHASVVFVIARRVTADDHLASEVVQEVFVHLWEAPDRVDLARGSIRSYLGVVAHRRAVDAVRRAERRDRIESAVTGPQPDALVDDQVADADARRWCRDRLLAALDHLPEEQRAAVVLAYFEGRTFKEVGQMLGIPEGTAKSRVRLAVARVRAIAGDDLRAAT